jgi:hypothetical protein
MSYPVCNSYEAYLKIRNAENELFCSKYAYITQSFSPSTSNGGGTNYQTQNNVQNFVTASTNSTVGYSHSSNNCVYRGLSG